MPILKKDESVPERPVIIFIYGEPGIGKTSLFNTSENPLLLDFDRGKDRAIFRQDTLVVNRWEDVEAEEKAETFKNYATVGIDTAKSCLDDFLLSYVIQKDYKYKKNKLAAYGAIGDEFKLFVSNRRSESADIVIIAHAKDEKDGEVIRKIPDVTGGSYQLLLRIADQVGYMSMKNNKRTIQFEPTDLTVGKNVARLPLIEIPDEKDPASRDFLSTIIAKVRKSIMAFSDAQLEAMKIIEDASADIVQCSTPEEFSAQLAMITEQTPAIKAQLIPVVVNRITELVPSIKKVEVMNQYMKLIVENKIQVTKTPLQDAIAKLRDARKWTFNKEKQGFEAPPKPAAANNEMSQDGEHSPGLKEEIPGESFADQEPIAQGAASTLPF